MDFKFFHVTDHEQQVQQPYANFGQAFCASLDPALLLRTAHEQSAD